MKNSFFNVENVRVAKIDFLVNDNFESKNVEVELSHQTRYALSKDGDSAKLQLELNLFEEDASAPFKLSLLMEGLFYWNKPLNTEELEEYLFVNGAAVLYSYARPLVTQITTFSGNLPLILPLINFVEDEEN